MMSLILHYKCPVKVNTKEGQNSLDMFLFQYVCTLTYFFVLNSNLEKNRFEIVKLMLDKTLF